MSTAGQTFFITGSSRGIGHELVRQLLLSNSSNRVIATIRQENSNTVDNSITRDPRLIVLKLDLGDPESFEALQKELEGLDLAIDVFISNAATSTARHDVLHSKSDEYLEYFKINAIGPIETLKILHPFMLRSNTRKIILTSSIMGSIQQFPTFLAKAYPCAPYCVSKAALNHLGKELSFELRDDKFIVISYNPGLVKTRVSDSNSKDDVGTTKEFKPSLEFIDYATKNRLSLEEAVKRELELIGGLSLRDSGKFFNHDGSTIDF